MPRRYRALHHVELSVLDYERSLAFYDRMFGYLGFQSFSTLGLGYTGTYYAPTLALTPHSYIGIQPAWSGGPHDFAARPVGIHHVAIWGKSRKEIKRFHEDFLLKEEGLDVTEAPAEYPLYAPGYYGVFFNDPINGIHWEVAHIPLIPGPLTAWRWYKGVKEAAKELGEDVAKDPFKAAIRKLPGPKELKNNR